MGAFTFVQKSASQGTGTNTVAPGLPGATTAGTLVIAVVIEKTGTATTGPANWVKVAEALNTTIEGASIWALLPVNNAGGATSFTFNGSGGMKAFLAEFSVSGGAVATGPTGTATGTSGTSFAVTASAANNNGDLGILCNGIEFAANTGGTWTDPGGWTSIGQDSGSTVAQHQDALYQTGLAAGTLSATTQFSVAPAGWAVALATFTIQAPAVVPAPARRASVTAAYRQRRRLTPIAPAVVAAAPPPFSPASPRRPIRAYVAAQRRRPPVAFPAAEIFQPLPAFQPRRQRVPITRIRRAAPAPVPAQQTPALPAAAARPRRAWPARRQRPAAVPAAAVPALPAQPRRRVRLAAVFRHPAPAVQPPPAAPVTLAVPAPRRWLLRWLPRRGTGVAVPTPTPAGGFAVARSTPTVADPRDGTATVAAAVSVTTVAGAVSVPTVTDPNDGAVSVSGASSTATVS